MELPVTGPREPAHRGIDLLPQRAGRPDHRRSADGASGHAVVLGVVMPSEARRFADLAGAPGESGRIRFTSTPPGTGPCPPGAGPLPSCGSSVARPAVAIKSARPGCHRPQNLRRRHLPDKPGMLTQPWNPALIKHRSSLHEPATP